MAKYTKEEKQKAIDLYIRYCRQATKVIKELGYPNRRHTLISWYKGYEEKGEVKDDGREEKKLSHVYSEDQVHAAVSFYIEHGKSLSVFIALSSDAFARPELGDVPIVQETGIPSKQSMMEER